VYKTWDGGDVMGGRIYTLDVIMALEHGQSGGQDLEEIGQA